MSAPVSHDPLVVNTRDGVCWTRRTVTSSGLALYAPEGVCGCPEFVMATLSELAEHGIVGSADALPVPVGPAAQEPRPIAYAAKNTDLLLADAAERSRAAEWPWDMWCRICHIRPTSHRTEAEALEAADRHVKLSHAPQAEVHRLMTSGGFAALVQLRARVAELEARPSPADVLRQAADDLTAACPDHSAAEEAWMDCPCEFADELRRKAALAGAGEDACACPAVDRPVPHQVGCPLDGVPGPDVVADGITRRIAPTQALYGERAARESDPGRRAAWRMLAADVPDGEHYPHVHHSYLTGHDLDLPQRGGGS